MTILDPGNWNSIPLAATGSRRKAISSACGPGSFGGTLSWYASPNPDERHTDGMLAADAAWVLERCARESSARSSSPSVSTVRTRRT